MARVEEAAAAAAAATRVAVATVVMMVAEVMVTVGLGAWRRRGRRWWIGALFLRVDVSVSDTMCIVIKSSHVDT